LCTNHVSLSPAFVVTILSIALVVAGIVNYVKEMGDASALKTKKKTLMTTINEDFLNLKRSSDTATVNEDGSVTFMRQFESIAPEINKMATDSVTSVILNKKITTTVITPAVTTKITIKTVVSPSNRMSAITFTLKKSQVQLKSLTTFLQSNVYYFCREGFRVLSCLLSSETVAVCIPFNCRIIFPKAFQAFLDSFTFLNLDIFVSLGLGCAFKNFDYIDRMVVETVVPLMIVGIIAFAYILLTVKKTADAIKDGQEANKSKTASQEQLESYIVPGDLVEKFSRSEIDTLRATFAYYDADWNGAIGAKISFL
jgi:hypothetical protein